MPFEKDGKVAFMMRDMEGICPGTLALSPGAVLIAYLLNGKHTAQDVQGLFAKHSGTVLSLAEIQNLVAELDRSLLLETPEVQTRRRKIYEEFRASAVRPAALRGGVYPDNILELAKFMGEMLAHPKGPGKAVADAPAAMLPPLGLVSPHIDFARGGPAYAWAYQALSETSPPDVIVALGVAHASPNSPWILTRKAYETPYGPVAVHGELCDAIQKALWYDAAEDEWVHRREHSLEFQALWLRYLWRDKTPPWVPILTSSFERFSPDKPPSSAASVEQAIVKIGDLLAERARGGSRIMILAGVDLAHVGPRFGDDIELDQELERRIEREDQASLQHALLLDPDAFYSSVVADGHWRKVCGLSALYTALRWIKRLAPDGRPPQGKLLAYGQAPDPAGGIVSFASAVYPRP